MPPEVTQQHEGDSHAQAPGASATVTAELTPPKAAVTIPIEFAGLVKDSRLLEAASLAAKEKHDSLVAGSAIDGRQFVDLVRMEHAQLAALTRYVTAFNTFGTYDENRPASIGRALMPVAVGFVEDRFETEDPPLTTAELLLKQLYESKQNQSIPVPDWFRPVKDLVQLRGGMEYATRHEEYLQQPPIKGNQEAQSLAEAITLKRDEYYKLYSQSGADADETIQCGGKIREMEQQAESLILSNPEIDPVRIASCCKGVAVTALMRKELYEALIDLQREIGKVIVYASGAKTIGPDTPLLVQLPNVAAHAEDSVPRIGLNAAAVIKGEQAAAAIPLLLETYIDLRQLLRETSAAWNTEFPTPGPNSARHDLKAKSDRALENLFPGDSTTNQGVIDWLATSDHPAVHKELSKLFTVLVDVPDTTMGKTKRGTVLEYPQNIAILASVVDGLIRGEKAEADSTSKVLMETQLRPLAELAGKFRERYVAGDVVGLGELIDTELKSAKVEASSPRGLGLLLALEVVVKDETVASNTKAFIKQLDVVTDLAAAQIPATAGGNVTFSKYIESARGRIMAGLNVTLEKDYIGHETEIKALREDVEDALLFSEFPRAWAKFAPNKVYHNGFLLVGPPGGGKSHGVRCIANSYNLALIKITHEELSRALAVATGTESPKAAPATEAGSKSVASQNPNSTADSMSEFVRRKVDQAIQRMTKTKARGCIVFLDEVEAEFGQRGLVATTPDHLARVDEMLTAIESQIAKATKVLFFAATNHYEFVDEAARRIGRFGHIVYLGPTTQKDVDLVVTDALAQQGVTIQIGKESVPYKELLKGAQGMKTLAIQQAVHHLCCKKRALAMRDKNASEKDPIEVTLEEISRVLERMRDRNDPPHFRKNAGESSAAPG